MVYADEFGPDGFLILCALNSLSLVFSSFTREFDVRRVVRRVSHRRFSSWCVSVWMSTSTSEVGLSLR